MSRALEKGRERGGALGAIAAVLCLGVWFGLGTWSTLRDWDVAIHGSAATGTVLREGSCGGDEATGAYVLYRERAGREHRAFSRSCDAGYRVGDAIVVLYRPEDPDHIVTAADIGDLRGWTLAYAVALAAVLVVIWLLLWGWRSQ
jgi:hypothetical protein